MFFFHSKNNLFPTQKNASALANDERTSVRKPSCVMHPKNAPRTIKSGAFPKRFKHYAYAGAMLETVPVAVAKGKHIRRPALVARMRYHFSPENDGFMVEEEMTASVRDLFKAKHPHATSIAAALTAYYMEKIPLREPVFSSPRLTLPTGDKPRALADDFFTKMNGLSGRTSLLSAAS